ncbi:MAG: TIM-barrel domain-containing protein, partial [Spirochaetota bacterium]
MKTWDTVEFIPGVTCSEGTKTVEVERIDGAAGTQFLVHASGSGAIRDVVLTSRGNPGFSDIFVAGPNIGGVEYAHPLQTVYLGLGGEHRDTLFGRQWMYTPPPLVFPFRSADKWFGVALSAPRGKNLFSGWTYRPSATDRTDLLYGSGATAVPSAFELEVHFDGYCRDEGHIASVHVLTEGKDSPLEVVQWYSQTIRDLGYAPSPTRNSPAWWKEPMLCAWGEQCNQAHAKNPLKWMGDSVTMYDTQSNQTRWVETLERHGIPVGVVSTSDKWQLHRERLTPDRMKYPDLRGFVDEQHEKGRKVIAWFGLWRIDDPPPSWCIRAENGEKLTADPESPGYSTQLSEGVRELISPSGYDIDGFFIDFTSDLPVR